MKMNLFARMKHRILKTQNQTATFLIDHKINKKYKK